MRSMDSLLPSPTPTLHASTGAHSVPASHQRDLYPEHPRLKDTGQRHGCFGSMHCKMTGQCLGTCTSSKVGHASRTGALSENAKPLKVLTFAFALLRMARYVLLQGNMDVINRLNADDTPLLKLCACQSSFVVALSLGAPGAESGLWRLCPMKTCNHMLTVK